MEQKYILIHAGIKGMRWGVRRYQNPDGTLTDAGRKRYGYGDDSDDHKTSRENARKRTEALSTKELKALNDRLQAEKQYNELTARKKSGFEKAAEEVLTNVGKNLATKYLTQFATKGIDALIGKVTGTNAKGTTDAAKNLLDKGKEITEKTKTSLEKKSQQRAAENEKARQQRAEQTQKEHDQNKSSDSDYTKKLSSVKSISPIKTEKPSTPGKLSNQSYSREELYKSWLKSQVNKSNQKQNNDSISDYVKKLRNTQSLSSIRTETPSTPGKLSNQSYSRDELYKRWLKSQVNRKK